MPELKQTLALPEIPRVMCLIGPQGEGKTTCAATFSDYYDQGSAKDLLWWSFDPDATMPLRMAGVETAGEFDFSMYSDLPTLEKEVLDAVRQTRELVAAGKIKAVVIDTWSYYDKAVLTYFTNKIDDQRKMYGQVLATQRRFLIEVLMPLGVPLVVLFHNKTREGQDKAEQQKQQQKNLQAGMDPGITNYLDVTGASADLFRRVTSLTFLVKATKEPSGKKYWLYRDGSALGFETKDRYQAVDFPLRVPANLKAVFDIIRRHRENLQQQQQEKQK